MLRKLKIILLCLIIMSPAYSEKVRGFLVVQDEYGIDIPVGYCTLDTVTGEITDCITGVILQDDLINMYSAVNPVGVTRKGILATAHIRQDVNGIIDDRWVVIILYTDPNASVPTEVMTIFADPGVNNEY